VAVAATVIAAVLVAPGHPAGAAPAAGLTFNGTSQYLRVGAVAAAPDSLSAAQFSLEAWFNRSGTGATTSTGSGGVMAAPLIAKGRAQADGSNVDMNYFLGIDASSKLVADFEEGAGQPSPGLNHPVTGVTVVTNNAWHHAAATYDGQTWKLYLDGRLDAVVTLAGPRAPRSDSIQRTAIGSALTSTGTAAGFFRGQIDEARIWNVARSGADIRTARDDELPATPGLIGRFAMNEGIGTATANLAGPNGATRLPTPSPPPWTGGYAFPQDAAAPAQPSQALAVAGDATASLSWIGSAEPDLAGYDVYRSTALPVVAAGVPLNGADLLTAPAFIDTGLANGTAYHYSVVGVDRSGNSSAPSVAVSVTPGGVVPPTDPVLIVAGDIASCSWTGDETTAALVAGLAGTVVTLGDNVYQNGTATEFTQCYAPSWGQFKERTRPTPGNHDYNTAGASGYFDYFNGVGVVEGPAGNRALGYYSFDVGTWHVVVLNSECEATTGLWLKGGCAAGTAQANWLAADLAATTTNNIIATYHKPRFSSAGSNPHMGVLWQLLYDRGADLVMSGHTHSYERFAPMNGSGAVDNAFGIREIVVGTGGASSHPFGTPLATSQVRNTGTIGVLVLTLRADRLDWRFAPAGGGTFADSGTMVGHGPPVP
jgi:hypothetical protein